jgi:glycosyltransferase involved in cell wall biosynthesis
MTILYIVSRLRCQGPIFQLYNLIKYTDKHKFNPTILTLSPEAEDSLLVEFRRLDIKYYSFGLSQAAGVLLGWILLRRFLRKHPVDIIHASDFRSSIVAVMGPKNIPRIITRRGLIRGSILEAIHSAACHRVDKIVAVSRFVQEAAGRRLRSHIGVILNGVDTEKFKPASIAERTQLRKRFSLPQDKQLFITTGWLNKGKDPISTIEGFLSSKVAEQSMLLLVGDGPIRGKCERLANGHSNVYFVGFVNNVAEYLQSSDFFVLSSLSEGCPNAAVEALACGLPVVLSDIGPHREILAFDPMAGRLFPVKGVSALARTLEEVTNADYESMRRAALEIVRDHLNARRMSTQYEQLYRELHEAYAKVQKA